MNPELIKKAAAEIKRIKSEREEMEREDSADSEASMLAFQLSMHEELIEKIDELISVIKSNHA